MKKKSRPSCSALRRLEYYIASAVGAITFLVYLPSLRNGFVNWDDNSYISENFHIISLNRAFFKWAFSDFSTRNWYPLTWISLALDHSAWGLNPTGYHLTNAVLHSISAFLVVVLATRLLEIWEKGQAQAGSKTFLDRGGKFIVSCVTGLLFGIHPLHVESVAWASERKDVLCALFYLLSILAYIRYSDGLKKAAVQEDLQTDSKKFLHNKMYFLSLFLFALALMSKPMAVSLPLVLLILDWHPLGRMRSLKTLLAVLIEKLPFLFFSLASSALTVMADSAAGGWMTSSAPLLTRVLVAAWSLTAYLWKMVLPLDLVPYYPYPKNVSLGAPGYIFPVISVLAAAFISIALSKKRRFWLVCLCYYVVTLIPVLGIIQFGTQPAIADRFTYLPSLAPFFLAGLASAWIWEKADGLKRRVFAAKVTSAAAIFLAVLSMSYLTIRQIHIWKNGFALWNYAIERQPSDMAYYGRADAYWEMGQINPAISDYSSAIALNPYFSYAYNDRGEILADMGQTEKALKDYDESLLINPKDAKIYSSRGALYLKMGNRALAIKDFWKACGLGDEEGCDDLRKL